MEHSFQTIDQLELMVITTLAIRYITGPLAPSPPVIGRSFTVDNSDLPPMIISKLVFLCALSICCVTVRELYKFKFETLAENRYELLAIIYLSWLHKQQKRLTGHLAQNIWCDFQ